jgi:hypothetical protein
MLRQGFLSSPANAPAPFLCNLSFTQVLYALRGSDPGSITLSQKKYRIKAAPAKDGSANRES